MGIITATFTWLSTTLVSVGFSAAAAAAVAKFLIVTAINLAITAVTSAFRKKPRRGDDSLNAEQQLQRRLASNVSLEVLVGRRAVAGVTLAEDSYGAKLEYAYTVTALSSKPCTAFNQLYMDGIPVTLSGDPTIQEVNVTSHFLGKNNVPRVKVRIFLGESGDVETLGSELLTNATFDTDVSGWSAASGGTYEWSAGTLLATCPDADSNAGAQQNVTLTIGQLYEVRVDIQAASFDYRIDLFGGGHSSIIFAQDATAIGVQVYRFTADATSTNIRIFASNDGGVGPNTVNFNSVSIKAVTTTTVDGPGDYLSAKISDKYAATDAHGDYCIMYVECRNTNEDLDTDTGENYIPFQGFPDIKADMSGVKVCDPRIAGYDYADPSTYVYSDNPALIEAQHDYGWYSGPGDALIVGHGYPVAILNDAQTISNANYCDTEGFTCHGLLRSTAQGDIEEVRKAYNAVRVEDAAQVYSVAEGNRVSSGTLDMSAYPSSYVTQLNKDGLSTDVYNEVATRYVEPAEMYGEKEMPVYSNAAWIEADNHIPRQMQFNLNMVTDLVQAAKLQKQEIYTSRAPATCVISDLPYSFIEKKVGDYITVTNSDVDYVNNKEWVIDSRGNNDRGDVTLSLRERPDAEAFAFDEATETPDVQIQATGTPAWSGIFYPTGSPYTGSGTFTPSSDFLEETVVNGLAQNASDLNQVELIQAGAGFRASATSTTLRVRSTLTTTLTTPTTTITPVDGVEAYSYAWSKHSGLANFTINSPTSATTSFSYNPGVAEIAGTIYKCVITDSNDPIETFTIYVAVIISNEVV